MHSVIEQRIAPGKFKCFTDSDLIQLKNSQVLRRVFDVVPIPHTSYKPSKERKGQDLFVWVPGDPVRSDKGFHVIQDFLKKIEDFPQIKLILSEKTRTLFKENKQLIFLPDYLSMEAYEKQMSAVDFIFLPYDSFEYKFRTSGIFVEAICSGAIPLVSKGTWMAHELEKFSLEDLTFTWKEVNLVEKLLSFLSNERKNFLSVMKKEYQRYHCRKNMAQTLQNFTR